MGIPYLKTHLDQEDGNVLNLQSIKKNKEGSKYLNEHCITNEDYHGKEKNSSTSLRG